jgi:hypothetical protein
MGNWSRPIGQDSAKLKLKLKLIGSTSEISEPDFNRVIKTIDCKYINKKGEALQKICNASPICRDNAYL